MLVHSWLNVGIQITDKNFKKLVRPWPKKIFVISFSQVQISRRMSLIVRVDESEKNLQNNLSRKGWKKILLWRSAQLGQPWVRSSSYSNLPFPKRYPVPRNPDLRYRDQRKDGQFYILLIFLLRCVISPQYLVKWNNSVDKQLLELKDHR